MTLLDSKAVFRQRVLDLGLDDLLPALRTRRIDSWGSFAYSCDYVPGSEDRESFFDLLTSLGVDRRGNQVPAVRRLFYEAVSLAAEELKAKTQRREDDPPRRLPPVERSARLQALQGRLGTAVRLRGESEPSDHLLDMVVQMVDDGRLRYVAWEECTKYDAETVGIKKDRTWKPDASGSIREVREAKLHPADISSDHLLRGALRRRSAAFEMGGLCSFEAHEDYVETLLEEYHRPPPPGFARLTLTQLERVDKEVFRLLAQALRGGLRPADDGGLPLTDLLATTLEKPGVQLLLMPLPTRAADRPAPKANNKRKRSPSERPAQGGRNQSKKKQNKPTPRRPAPAPGRPGPAMPKGLVGKAATDPHGSRICFGFNLGTCKETNVQPGQSCPRGKHVCATPGCFGPHPTTGCTK